MITFRQGFLYAFVKDFSQSLLYYLVIDYLHLNFLNPEGEFYLIRFSLHFSCKYL